MTVSEAQGRPAEKLDDHRAFLNRYYGLYHRVYDVTRKYYLFGRDAVLRELLQEPWERLIEIGPGTGRNLAMLHDKRPNARYGGIEASDVMLDHAQKACPWATLHHGFAEQADIPSLLGGAPDRILFSYCLSMVTDPLGALAHARRSLAPGGEVVVVDFADLAGIRQPFRTPFQKFLENFHVHPLADAVVSKADRLRHGPLRYYLVARFGRQE